MAVSRRIYYVTCIFIVVALVGGIACMFGCAKGGAPQQTDAQQRNAQSDDSLQTEKAQTSDTEIEATAQKADAPDLTDPADHFAVNRLISSFTIAGPFYLDDVFDAETSSSDQWAGIAIYKYVYSGGSGVESCDKQIDGERCNVRIDTKELDKVTEYLSNVLVDWSNVRFFHYKDGFVYYEITGGHMIEGGPAVATRVLEDNGRTLTVEYVAYRSGRSGHAMLDSLEVGTHLDESIYAESVEQLNDRIGVEAPNVHGTAVIAYKPDKHGWDLKLVSMNYTFDDGSPVRSVNDK